MESAPVELHDASEVHLLFGPFCMVPGKRLLMREGLPIEIGGRALDILMALVEQPGKVIAKRELIRRVWPDAIVEEGSLRFHMNGLRKILGDGEEGARYINTQVGVGYAFVAPVERKAHAMALPVSPMAHVASRLKGLPPPIPLIGRDVDIQLIVDRLATPRLLSIVGTGGVGKTSLAVAAAHRLCGHYEAVHFIDLAQVEDASLVPSALVGAAGLPVQADDPVFVLLAHLQLHTLLFVIDNCEHVIDAVSAVVERIRSGAPETGLLTTSREPLRALEEQLHWLNPLDFPAESTSYTFDELVSFPAVKLFVERVSAGNASSNLTTDEVRLIADMCRRLDGLALPIELAAGRVATHGIQATHSMLGERFSLGWAGRRTALPRHQTLRATLDWSYGLLSDAERLVFDRLAVFVGPFSQDAAAQIVGDARVEPVMAAALLDELASKGLVAVDHSEAIHSYRMLEMTRAYARERLATHDRYEAHAIAFRHGAYYTALLGQLGTTPDEIFERSARLASQLGNIRSALEWSFGPDGDPGLALPMAAASAPLFLHFSLLVECRTWCGRAIELLELGYFGTPTEMELQAALGLVLMFTRGNSESAEKALLRAMDIAVTLGDHGSQLRLLGRLQIFYERIGDFASSLAWAEQAMGVGDAIGEPEAISVAASLAGVSHHLLGNQVLARSELEKALRHSQPPRRSHTIHYGFDHRNRTGLALARTLWLQGYPDEARAWAERVERDAAALNHPVTHCIALVWTLGIYTWLGDLERAEVALQTFAHLAESNMLAPYIAATPGMRAAIRIRSGNAGDAGDAIGWLEDSLSRLHGMRYELLTSTFETALTEGLILSGRFDEAARLIDGTIHHCRASGDAYALPDLLRIRSRIFRAQGNPGAAVELIEESLAMARAQGAHAWELRSSTELARAALEAGRPGEAIEILGPWLASARQGASGRDQRDLLMLWDDAQRRMQPV
ncbi:MULTISPECIES: ATP-binding protein [Dyella]|uniref:Tetratricopeptide repeat protein n=2 Tax=Dyella TaxID=231454 RepID=A0A4R0Z1J0_9GAMM|nr:MULTISPECIES: winged helix-turn-helix domain-containing protein [Dyella]TBR39377.1 tetratricopeptide repeat protein [Dyella terrae]TCI13036.1 tetratricopeptide repeat protein [Dyella soli]